MIFRSEIPRLLAVLDWSFSTLGHPFADLALSVHAMAISNATDFRGLAGLDAPR